MLFCFLAKCQATFLRIQPQLSSRVDTTSEDVKAIVKLYENYLNSSPEVIKDSPYWNSVEKGLYADYDFSRESMFQGGLTAARLCSTYNPFVMSVESIGEKYQIRVMFSSGTSAPEYMGSKVWCIQKLNVVKENGLWVFENLIVELTKKWESKSAGVIQYVYPPTHDFDLDEAKQAERFCQDIIKRFNPTYNSNFKYYLTSSIDDMGLMENFDYYFVGVTTGKARENMLLTAKGNEFYAHEIVHKLLPKNENRGKVIEEGLAEFLGTKTDQNEYREVMSKLAKDLKTDSDKIKFTSVVSQSVTYNGYQTAYPAGAAMCELVFELKGDQGLLALIQANTKEYKNLVSAVCEITDLSFDELVKEWNAVLMQYAAGQ